MAQPLKHIEIYTDGACKGNPGVGGWGALLKYGQVSKEIFGGERTTTNNQMELMAVIKALSFLKEPCRIDLYLDSQYVRKGITEWIHQWKTNGWRTADKKPVKNLTLWQELEALAFSKGHDIHWVWVKGHADNVGNQRADALANEGVNSLLTQ
ncbi:MAG: ribonuclease HI [Gammaproteobacteria bacterium]|nr:ribonuclease HI [Gammaproteobacteria bacterium]